MTASGTVVGVDVGGASKGFHAVALRDGKYLDKFQSSDAARVAQWCRDTIQAQVIAIDAPSHWSLTGRARPCEAALMEQGIWCFATPTQKKAMDHPKNYFGWMQNGIELYNLLQKTHPLLEQLPLQIVSKCCFETFPHAITCSLYGGIRNATKKRKDRWALIKETTRIDPSELTNIDWIDAALCALSAYTVLVDPNSCKSYGELDSGYIVVPRSAARKSGSVHRA